MDIVQLQNFQTIARLEHLTKAAEILHTSQPALSASLSRLEDELGVELFDRVGRRLCLNECGHLFLHHVDVILQSVSDARAELETMTHKKNPILTIYFATKLSMDQVYFRYKRENPETILKRIEILHDDIPRALTEKDCDFITVTCMDPEEYNCCYEIVNEDQLLLAVPKNNPLASRKSVRIEELKDETFIGMPSGSSFREMTDRVCQQAGFTPKVANECFRCQLVNYLLNNTGIAFVSNANLRDICDSRMLHNYVSVIPVDNIPTGMNDVVLWRKGRKMSPAAQAFLDLIRQMKTEEKPSILSCGSL